MWVCARECKSTPLCTCETRCVKCVSVRMAVGKSVSERECVHPRTRGGSRRNKQYTNKCNPRTVPRPTLSGFKQPYCRWTSHARESGGTRPAGACVAAGLPKVAPMHRLAPPPSEASSTRAGGPHLRRAPCGHLGNNPPKGVVPPTLGSWGPPARKHGAESWRKGGMCPGALVEWVPGKPKSPGWEGAWERRGGGGGLAGCSGGRAGLMGSWRPPQRKHRKDVGFCSEVGGPQRVKPKRQRGAREGIHRERRGYVD